MTDLERAIAEQRECAEYIVSGGEGCRGAISGLCDWTAEELLIRAECEKIAGMQNEAAQRQADYERLLASKAQCGMREGFKPTFIPSQLFDFQAATVEWNVEMGRSADFLDCGMGKTFIELVWAENVIRHTNKPVLIFTPVAVARQFVREGEKFGIEVHHSRDGQIKKCVNVTNYERAHYFDPGSFSGVVCDESSALKAAQGKRRMEITEFMRTVPYRLMSTATPAPNDYIELGTTSEALGILGQVDMLTRFFKNDNNTIDVGRRRYNGAHPEAIMHQPKWRFKGHAKIPFFRWLAGWTRAGRRPSDLGQFSDERFVLPELIIREHVVETHRLAEGMLFALPATNRAEELEERRRTIEERCERVAELVSDTGKPFIVFCQLNPEGELLNKLIPDAVEISGSEPDDAKEDKWAAFMGGESRGAITKHRIGAWGLNLQFCPHVVEFADHSFEAHYQAVRRCWRFGQTEPVINDIISTEGQRGAKESLQRKAEQADKMFDYLVQYMHEALAIDGGWRLEAEEVVPSWL